MTATKCTNARWCRPSKRCPECREDRDAAAARRAEYRAEDARPDLVLLEQGDWVWTNGVARFVADEGWVA